MEKLTKQILDSPEFSVRLSAEFKENGKPSLTNLCFLIGSGEGWVLIRGRLIKGELSPWLTGTWEDILGFEKLGKKELKIKIRHPETKKEVFANTYGFGLTPQPRNSTLIWASLPSIDFEPILQKIMNKRNARGGVVKTFDENPMQLPAVYLGGYGQPDAMSASEPALLSFNSESLELGGTAYPWTDLVGFSVGGPGTFETGGGWIGGGFGIAGAIEGAVIGSVLNALTTKRHVLTEFVFIFDNAEINFATDKTTPEELDMYLSPLRALIRKSNQQATSKKSKGDIFCSQCGSSLKSNAKFCSGCGEKL